MTQQDFSVNMPQPSQEKLPAYWQRMGVLLIAILIGLLVLGQGLSQLRIARHGNSEVILNIAGRQRMLSERIARLALMLTQDAPNPVRAQQTDLVRALTATRNELDEADTRLTGGDLAGNDHVVRALYDRQRPFLDGMRQATICLMALYTLQPAASGCAAERSELVSVLLNDQAGYVALQEQIVGSYQDIFAAEQTSFNNSRTVVTFLQLLAVVLLGIFFIQPLIRRVAETLTAVQKSETQFRLLTERAIDIVAEYTLEGVFAYVSPAAEKILGYAPHELIGRSIYELLHPDEIPTIRAAHESLLQRRGFVTISYRLRHQHGHYIWVETSARAITDPHTGRLGTIIAASRDVTDRRQAEQRLAESEALYRTMITTMHDGIVVQDAHGAISECNAAAERILGLTRDQMMGRTSIDPRWRAIRADGSPFPGEDHPAMVVLRTGTAQHDVLMGVHKPCGELTWILINSQPLFHTGDAVPYAAVTTFTDFTDLRRTQEKLIESERLFRLAFEESPMGVSISDMNGRLIRTNKSLMKMYGIEDGDSVEALMRSAFYPDDLALIVQNVRQMREGSLQRFDSELKFRHKSGSVGWRTGTSVVVQNAAGQPAYILALSFDTTARKQAEERQAALLAQVEAVNRDLSDFAHIVSHDLKAPLRAIHTLADWLVVDYGAQLPPDAHEMLTTIKERVNRLGALIDGILAYSRAGRAAELVAGVDTATLVRDVVELLLPPPHIRIEIAPDLPRISAPPIHLRQIFQNLITNAIKFNDKPVGHIRIAAEQAGDFWQFSVADNGIGIDEKHFDRIFQIFQTLQARDVQENTGVGLSIVRKIVEIQGGRVWLQSTPGSGTTFYFTLPREQELVK
jgi:PAS domain S-box-containing protein